jgi:hypothetical protein
MMLQANTPWIGLLALVAMFVLPFLPRRWFEGPRVIKHYPIRHICAECGEAWTNAHDCQTFGLRLGLVPGQLRRPSTGTSLERRRRPRSEADD